MITWDDKAGSTDASDLGLKPGEWPLTLVVEEAVFERKYSILDGVDLAYVVYRDRAGRSLRVFND